MKDDSNPFGKHPVFFPSMMPSTGTAARMHVASLHQWMNITPTRENICNSSLPVHSSLADASCFRHLNLSPFESYMNRKRVRKYSLFFVTFAWTSTLIASLDELSFLRRIGVVPLAATVLVFAQWCRLNYKARPLIGSARKLDVWIEQASSLSKPEESLLQSLVNCFSVWSFAWLYAPNTPT